MVSWFFVIFFCSQANLLFEWHASNHKFATKESSVLSRLSVSNSVGNIDVGDGCWWQLWDIDDRFFTLKRSTKMILSSISQNCRDHKVTNIGLLPTFLWPSCWDCPGLHSSSVFSPWISTRNFNPIPNSFWCLVRPKSQYKLFSTLKHMRRYFACHRKLRFGLEIRFCPKIWFYPEIRFDPEIRLDSEIQGLNLVLTKVSRF